ILGFSEILLDASMNLTAGERIEFLRNIHSSGQHLLGLINDILDLAKIEAGRRELHLEAVDVPHALQQVTTILEPMARQQGLKLLSEGLEKARPIQADHSKLKQVRYNLLSNAVKFTPAPGTITLNVRHGADGARGDGGDPATADGPAAGAGDRGRSPDQPAADRRDPGGRL